jgi:hypothetical protein
MSEERAVQQVLAKYVRGVDTRDGAAVAALFTDTGRVEISYNNSGKSEPLGELVGRECAGMNRHVCRGCKSPTEKEERLHSDLESCVVRREAYGEA